MFKRLWKNEKGLTLIELLAVVVILGIIAAIAVPSIGGLIDNTKKDAHVANAMQMINSAKLAVTGNNTLLPTTGSKYIPLAKLEADGYIETMKDPDNGTYGTATANETTVATIQANSHVEITASSDGKTFTYKVKLVNSTRGVQSATKAAVAETGLNRDAVIKTPTS